MKKLFIALFLLIPTVILAGGPTVGGFGFGGNPRNAQSYAFFEAFPASGAGVPTVCSTTAPTGARGQALTFTRASSATCTKTRTGGGLATTGIANGDLVVLSSNQPRIEYGSDGVLGLLVESSRTNSVLRSQELDNAAWSAISGGGPALPVVTPNAAVAPDGTTTAEQIDFPAVAAVGYSLVRQTGVGSVGSASTRTLYARAVSSDCSFYFADASAGSESVLCSAVTTSWTRCSVNVSAANVLGYFDIGTNRNVTSEGATSACSVYVWGVQAETTTDAYATSYIPTTSAAVTRAEEAADFAVALSPTAGMCIASSMNYPSLSVLGVGGGTMGATPTTGAAGTTLGATYLWPYSSAVNGAVAADSAGVVSAGSTFYQPGVAATLQGRYLIRHQGGVGNWTVCTNASCTTQGTTSTWGTPAFTRLKLDRATAAAGNAVAHIISRIQVDSAPTRCSP